MNWGSLEAFLAMGGYALYVWGSYAVAAALMIVEVVLLAQRRRNIIEQLGQSTRARRSPS